MRLHPQIATLVQGMASNPDARPTHELTPKEARDGYRALAAMLGPGPAVGAVEDRAIPGPVGEIPVRIYRPLQPEGGRPPGVLVFYHGGGWVIGDLETHDRECRMLCNGAGCLVVAVDYRLAPEHPFPAAVDDAFAALRWVARNAGDLGADPSRLAVGGDSAGGNLSAVVSLLARDAGGPPLRFQLLIYPAVDARPGDAYRSRVQNAEAPFLPQATVDYFMDHYLGSTAGAPRAAGALGSTAGAPRAAGAIGSTPGARSDDAGGRHSGDVRNDPRISPLLASSHRALPPALVVTAEFDPLRDEGEAYARALEDANVPVRLHRYDGMPHVFFQLSPIVDDGSKMIEEAAAALREALA